MTFDDWYEEQKYPLIWYSIGMTDILKDAWTEGFAEAVRQELELRLAALPEEFDK